MDSEDQRYGGQDRKIGSVVRATKQECDGQDYSFAYPLAGYGVAVFEFDGNIRTTKKTHGKPRKKRK